MAYAVFKDVQKLSRTFATREETVKKADEADLVETVAGKPVLEDNFDDRAVRAHQTPNTRATKTLIERLTCPDLLTRTSLGTP